jgi:microcystin-dependent protein
MSEPFIGEIRMVSFNFAPKGWQLCNGQLLPINQFQALFSILGTTYGGNGQNTFGLPDLRGRVPLHFGNGFTQGGVGGEEGHVLLGNEIPGHSHSASANAAAVDQVQPGGNFWGNPQQSNYATSANTTMAGGTVSPAGGNQAHENRQPYLVVNFVIAINGVFPSRN